MMAHTASPSAAITARKISAQRASMGKAITIDPSTTKGERSSSRSAIFTPVWAWLTSLVIRVIIAGTPTRSTSGKDSAVRRLNSACRTSAANPVAAFAAKNWATTAMPSPTRPSAIKRAHIRQTCPALPAPMPRSMIEATTSGTNRSNSASSILNSGASIHSLRYFLRYCSIAPPKREDEKRPPRRTFPSLRHPL